MRRRLGLAPDPIATSIPETSMNIAHAARSMGIAILFMFPALAAAQVEVIDAWVRGTVAGQQVTGAFMQLTSPSDSALVDVASPAAKFAEIHEMKKDGDVMKMKAVDKLPLPAGKRVQLSPGGYHVMLFQLKRALKAGDVVPLTLTFEDKAGRKSTVEVKAAVKALTSGDVRASKP
jgi:periplasmic copper chaperone A